MHEQTLKQLDPGAEDLAVPCSLALRFLLQRRLAGTVYAEEFTSLNAAL